MTPASAAPETRRPVLRRRTAVLWALASGAIVLGTGAQTWIESSQLTGLPGTVVTTSGNQAVAVVPAMALVGMASGIALSMARRIGRVVTSVLLVLAGAVTAWAAVAAALGPADAARTQVSGATGTTAEAGSYAVTFWPWLTLAAGVLLGLCGVAVLLFGRGWRDSRRYDTAGATRATTGASGTSGVAGAAAGPAGPAATSGTSRAAGSTGSADTPAGPAEPDGTVDEIDAWDDLSRGNDPT